MRKDNNRYTRAVNAVDAVDATSLPPVPVTAEQNRSRSGRPWRGNEKLG